MMQHLTSNEIKNTKLAELFCMWLFFYPPFDLVTTKTKLFCLYLCSNSLSLPDDGLFNLPMCSKCIPHNLFFKHLSLKSKRN